MKRETRAFVRQRSWIIYKVLVASREAEEISLNTGVSVTTVHHVIATYNPLGPGPLTTSASCPLSVIFKQKLQDSALPLPTPVSSPDKGLL